VEAGPRWEGNLVPDKYNRPKSKNSTFRSIGIISPALLHSHLSLSLLRSDLMTIRAELIPKDSSPNVEFCFRSDTYLPICSHLDTDNCEAIRRPYLRFTSCSCASLSVVSSPLSNRSCGVRQPTADRSSLALKLTLRSYIRPLRSSFTLAIRDRFALDIPSAYWLLPSEFSGFTSASRCVP